MHTRTLHTLLKTSCSYNLVCTAGQGSGTKFRVPLWHPCQSLKGHSLPRLEAATKEENNLLSSEFYYVTHFSISAVPSLHRIGRGEGLAPEFGDPAPPTCHLSDVLCDPIIAERTTQHRVHLTTRIDTNKSLWQ